MIKWWRARHQRDIGDLRQWSPTIGRLLGTTDHLNMEQSHQLMQQSSLIMRIHTTTTAMMKILMKEMSNIAGKEISLVPLKWLQPKVRTWNPWTIEAATKAKWTIRRLLNLPRQSRPKNQTIPFWVSQTTSRGDAPFKTSTRTTSGRVSRPAARKAVQNGKWSTWRRYKSLTTSHPRIKNRTYTLRSRGTSTVHLTLTMLINLNKMDFKVHLDYRRRHMLLYLILRRMGINRKVLVIS